MKLRIDAHRISENKKRIIRYQEILKELEQAVACVIEASTESQVDDAGNYTISFDSSDPRFDAAYEQLKSVEIRAYKEFRDIRWTTPGIIPISSITKADDSGN